MWRSRAVIFLAVVCVAAGLAAGFATARRGRAPAESVQRQPVDLDRTAEPVARHAGGEGVASPQGLSPAARLALAAASLNRANRAPPAPEPDTHDRNQGRGIKHSVTVDELPAPQRAVVLQVAQGRAMTKMEAQRKIHDGQPVDEVEFDIDGVEHELTMDADGKVVASEFEIDVADIPVPVTSAIQRALPGATVTEVERHQSRDLFFFEVQLTHQGREHELDVTDDGRVLKDKLRPLENR